MDQRLSLGPGIFGWTMTHVHANMVAKQLQHILHIDLLPKILALRMKSDGELSVGKSEGVGKAKANEI